MKFSLMLGLSYDVMRGPWQGWEYQAQFKTRSRARMNEAPALLAASGTIVALIGGHSSK